MQGTENAAFRKNQNKAKPGYVFVYCRGLAIGKSIIMWGCFLATNLFLNFFFISGNCGF